MHSRAWRRSRIFLFYWGDSRRASSCTSNRCSWKGGHAQSSPPSRRSRQRTAVRTVPSSCSSFQTPMISSVQADHCLTRSMAEMSGRRLRYDPLPVRSILPTRHHSNSSIPICAPIGTASLSRPSCRPQAMTTTRVTARHLFATLRTDPLAAIRQPEARQPARTTICRMTICRICRMTMTSRIRMWTTSIPIAPPG